MLKRLGIWIACVLSGLVLITGGIYLFLIRPLAESVEVAKPVMAKVAIKFHECTEAKDVGDCVNFTSENFQNVSPVSEWGEFNAKVNKVLGKRMTAEIDEKSINVTTFKSIKGTSSKRFTAKFKVMYENDPFVVENYVFINSDDDDKFLIEAYNINSKELFK